MDEIQKGFNEWRNKMNSQQKVLPEKTVKKPKIAKANTSKFGKNVDKFLSQKVHFKGGLKKSRRATYVLRV